MLRPNSTSLPPDVVLAPLWRRVVASIIDFTFALAAILGVAAAIAGLLFVLLVALEGEDERVLTQIERWTAPSTEPVEKREASDNRRRWAAFGAWLPVMIMQRNHQTYGQTLMRIRRVRADDGRALSVKNAIVRYVVAQLMIAARPKQTLADKEHERAMMKKTVVPELAKLLKKHPGDRVAFLREALPLYWEHRPNALTRLTADMSIRLGVHVVCVLLLPQRQSLPDLVAGIVMSSEERTA